MFSSLSKTTLAKAALFQNAPVYVQFYVTARCNLTCGQCNIIYANADVPECTLDDVQRIADNFAAMGVAMVLLTGGEPFARKDLPEIIYAFESRGVHVRMQTNGYASEDQILRAIEAGGRDISISLDSLDPSLQDEINGQFNQSWHRALKAMALFSQHLPAEDSFASLGCVLQPYNLGSIEDVVKFGTEISWFTSLVPAHVTDYGNPKGFRSFDRSLTFLPNEHEKVAALLRRMGNMRREGYLLYDSDEYLDDILRFIKGSPITWRDKNKGICDSPNLYFALLPNGEFAPCCDYRLNTKYSAASKDFPELYHSELFRSQVKQVATACDGCMYGSYPEITIAMRFLKAKLSRAITFLASPPKKNWPFTYEELLDIARRVRNENRERPKNRSRQDVSSMERTVRIVDAKEC